MAHKGFTGFLFYSWGFPKHGAKLTLGNHG